MAGTNYLVVWEFWVNEEKAEEFEENYGAEGVWAKFFGAGAGYRGTELLRDPEKKGRYFTVDRWDSEAAYEAFRAEHEAEYKRIDAECEALTEKEVKVGAFVVAE